MIAARIAHFTLLVAACGGPLACASPIHGEIHSKGPPLGAFDFIATRCGQPRESEAGAGEWIATDKAGFRLGIYISMPAFQSPLFVQMARVDQQSDVRFDGATCRVFSAEERREWNNEGGIDDFSGHLRLDCDTSAGGHVAGWLDFSGCAY